MDETCQVGAGPIQVRMGNVSTYIRVAETLKVIMPHRAFCLERRKAALCCM